MGSPAAPPLCNLAATVEDFFWHQTMNSLRFQMSDFGVIWHERYVDNRFILLRDSAPSTAVLRNFLSLEFYRPPVMLETQNDTKVLGYMCDSSSRTITPQLPDHPSQIKGVARPGEHTSGMDSCLHTGHVAACGRIHLRPGSGPRVHISRMAQSLPL